jgi:hypothetical protein
MAFSSFFFSASFRLLNPSSAFRRYTTEDQVNVIASAQDIKKNIQCKHYEQDTEK